MNELEKNNNINNLYNKIVTLIEDSRALRKCSNKCKQRNDIIILEDRKRHNRKCTKK